MNQRNSSKPSTKSRQRSKGNSVNEKRQAKKTKRRDVGNQRAPSQRAPSQRTTSQRASQREPQRLQKVLAAAGLGSRRSCEELILTGRVQVDRQTVTELGTRVDPYRQTIHVDGTLLKQPRRVYYALHKPAGVVSTNRDPAGRTRVIDLIDTDERLFSVGRLDKSSEGLMLLTNDGDLAQSLTHPRYGVEKTYHVEAAGQLQAQDLGKLRKGVHLAEGLAHVERARVIKNRKQSTLLEIVLKEGRNREIRRLLAAVGHKAMRLRRVAIGPLRLGDLPVGAHRPLTSQEIRALEEATQQRKSTAEKKSSQARRPLRKKGASSRSKNSGQFGARKKSRSASRRPSGAGRRKSKRAK